MKKLIFVFIQLFFFLSVSAQVIKTKDMVVLREQPGGGKGITAIPKGKTLQVNSYVMLSTFKDGTNILASTEKWAVVTYNGSKGYILEGTYIVGDNKENIQVNQSLDVPVEQSGLLSYNVTPQGAKALCKDGSFSFSPLPNSACSNHGGVVKWLNIEF